MYKNKAILILQRSGNDMKTSIQIKLFASLGRYMPESGDAFQIDTGITVRNLALGLGIPLESAKLIFVNGQKRDLTATLSGGERVAIFPPVGGG
jgi:sulfur-carrier protein